MSDPRTEPNADPLAQQAHYADWGIEPIEFIRANMLDFCEGNVVKYLMRCKYQMMQGLPAQAVTGYRKALVYLKWLLEDAETEVQFKEELRETGNGRRPAST